MLLEMVQASVFWLNIFPPDDGVLDTLSPRDLIFGQNIYYNREGPPECDVLQPRKCDISGRNYF
jgi:hypothetical protein